MTNSEFQRSPESLPNADKIIASHVSRSSLKYTNYLAFEHEDDTSLEGTAHRENQMRELRALTAMIDAWAAGKVNFVPAIRSRKIYDGAEPKELFTVRLVKEGDILHAGRPQVQLNLHGLISARNPEQVMQVLNDMSLRGGDPAKVLQEYYRLSRAQTLRINTILVRKDDFDRVGITPNAGIQFDWKKGSQHAYAKGLSFIGGVPHTTDNRRNTSPQC